MAMIHFDLSSSNFTLSFQRHKILSHLIYSLSRARAPEYRWVITVVVPFMAFRLRSSENKTKSQKFHASVNLFFQGN